MANMVTNVYVAYSMGVVPYTDSWLKSTQDIMLWLLKKSMHIPINMDDEPFFMSVENGGRGLISLIDLNVMATCASVLHLMNGDTLGGAVVLASWNHANVALIPSVNQWLQALTTLKLVVWPKLCDLVLVGNLVDCLATVDVLIKKGIHWWSQLLVGEELIDWA